MSGHKHKNSTWDCPTNADGTLNLEHVTHQILMDIRDELQKLNGILSCRNFLNIPKKLDRIGRNTTKPKSRKLKVAK